MPRPPVGFLTSSCPARGQPGAGVWGGCRTYLGPRGRISGAELGVVTVTIGLIVDQWEFPYSVVRRLKKCDAKGAATAKMITDQMRAASTGCCIGHA